MTLRTTSACSPTGLSWQIVYDSDMSDGASWLMCNDTIGEDYACDPRVSTHNTHRERERDRETVCELSEAMMLAAADFTFTPGGVLSLFLAATGFVVVAAAAALCLRSLLLLVLLGVSLGAWGGA